MSLHSQPSDYHRPEEAFIRSYEQSVYELQYNPLFLQGSRDPVMMRADTLLLSLHKTLKTRSPEALIKMPDTLTQKIKETAMQLLDESNESDKIKEAQAIQILGEIAKSPPKKLSRLYGKNKYIAHKMMADEIKMRFRHFKRDDRMYKVLPNAIMKTCAKYESDHNIRMSFQSIGKRLIDPSKFRTPPSKPSYSSSEVVDRPRSSFNIDWKKWFKKS